MDVVQSNVSRERVVYLDILRVLAIFFVIFIHTSNNGFNLYYFCNGNDIVFWVYLCISIFCNFAVPVFFMISGALLLENREEPLEVIFKKRIIYKVITLILVNIATNAIIPGGGFFYGSYMHI